RPSTRCARRCATPSATPNGSSCAKVPAGTGAASRRGQSCSRERDRPDGHLLAGAIEGGTSLDGRRSALGGRHMRKPFLSMLVVSALQAMGAGTAVGQSYPAHYITIIVPFTAGSPVDTISRVLAPGMSRVLGQQVVVENVTGAGGTTGITRAAKAAPDGYTMVIASTGTHAGAAALYPNLGYDPADSFESIGFIGSTPVALVARRDFPPSTLQEVIAYLRANQKTATLAHGGVGSISHIFCTYFQSLIGVRTVGVPFRGLSDSTQALLAGQVDYSCNQAPLTLEHVRAGTLKAYAITSERRSTMMPDLPTAAESGLPAFTLGAW